MKYTKLAVIFFIFFMILFNTACTNVQVDLSKPEIVVQEFMEGQASGNQKLVKALLTNELKNKFKEQKLYLSDRKNIKKGKLVERESLLAWDEETKKVYQINYSVEYKEGKETKRTSLREAVSLTKQDDKWYIDDYVPDKN